MSEPEDCPPTEEPGAIGILVVDDQPSSLITGMPAEFERRERRMRT